MKRTTTAIVLALALAACQQNDPNNIAIDEGNNATGDVETLPPDEGNEETAARNDKGLNEADDAGSEDPNQAFIPAQYRGRWGMVPNDCQPGRSDAKGLITIGDTTVKFYEAVATLKEQRPAIATSFAGQFDFTGEGQNWKKVMTLTRTGDTLKRAEEEGTFTYKRCA
ncbi:lipoprotein [Sphingomonas sp. NSE70-1]|uniref:Type IV secretion system putative lipoprotein virB7 n=1 Tax=Sphingomonas caseinilyticus TaxID=2908205 RepID=A0ABT0RT56_9SPHN|nr:lipoprotein [Sphingomonas caseinilyticus]MCL6698182.1 lipoprotein [Sphingomonas caseinilyticus]